MRRPSDQTFPAAESDATPAQADPVSDPVDLAPAIARRAIREQDVIAVLTEMCRCLLVARRQKSETASTDSIPSASKHSHPSAPQSSSSPDGGH